MIHPTVHLNGTSRSELMEGYANAAVAVQDAIAMVGAHAHPNGRDYYPQGPSAIATAMDEHASRIARLKAVHDELETLYVKLAEEAR